MKRLLGILTVLVLLAFAAPPALAQGPNRGDRMCMGGNTTVQSNETPRDVFLFGCGARVAAETKIERDVISFGGNVALEQGTDIGRDLVVFGGNVDVAGHIRRKIVVVGGNLTLEPTAVVDGDVQAFGNLNQRSGSVVRGRINSNSRVTFGGGPFNPFVSFGNGNVFGLFGDLVFGFFRGLLYAIAFAALGALTVVFLPAQTRQVGAVAERSALPSLGVGCLTLVVGVSLYLLLVLVSIILAITIIGIPVAILLLVIPPVALAAAWLFGWIAIGEWVGEKILEGIKARDTWRVPIFAVIVGIFLLSLLGAVPFFGWLVSLFVGLLGIGAVILSRFGTRPYPPAGMVPYALAPVAPVAPVAPAPPAAPVPPTPPAPSAPAAPATPASDDPGI